MKKYTGAIILASLSALALWLSTVLGIDSALAVGSHATISEYLFNWIKTPENFKIFVGTLGGVIAGIIYFFYHIVSFKPLD